jgi:hypothetical protein
MLDRATLRALAEHPERNDQVLNVALAEEGDAAVLFALAECPEVGSEALATIAARVEKEGELVGHEEEPDTGESIRRGSRRENEPLPTNGTDLDMRLVVHPRADEAVRDAVLARHPDDPVFVLAAAAHPRATRAALERAARWPAVTALHDRPWLTLLDPATVPPLVLDEWAGDDDPVLREAAAIVGRDRSRLDALARDHSRRVRRAVAGNPGTPSSLLNPIAEHDAACEVRARASERLAHPEGAAFAAMGREDVRTVRGVDVTNAAFRAAVRSMQARGTLAADVAHAMRGGPLDLEGARLAGHALDEASVGSMVASRPLGDEIGVALAAGIAFRDDTVKREGGDADDVLLAQCVRALAGADRSGGVVTGKARLAAWLAEGVSRAGVEEVASALGRTSLAADRMVLGRVAAKGAGSEGLVSTLAARAVEGGEVVPVALVELAWRDVHVPNDTITRLCARVRTSTGSAAEASPENEVDLDPRARPLDVLEGVGSALVGRAPLSPRAALALVALEPRRVRYVLSALPQWRGVLSGAHVARVLRAHAGALSAAGPSATRRASGGAAGWTQRRLDEAELAVALAVGDLTPGEAAVRILAGQDVVLVGTTLAAGMEARAAIDGLKALEPLVDILSRARSQDAAMLAAWLIVETLDRQRSAAAVAAALDAPWTVSASKATRTGATPASARGGADPAAGRSVVPPGLAEALATLERRTPGRLALVTPQTPRGRATLVSGIARAYRALGGMSVAEG